MKNYFFKFKDFMSRTEFVLELSKNKDLNKIHRDKDEFEAILIFIDVSDKEIVELKFLAGFDVEVFNDIHFSL